MSSVELNSQIPVAADGRRVGYGKSFASFGEIVQGRTSDNEDFLVTLPVDLWSTCELICTPIRGPLVIECDLPKSRATVEQVLEQLGLVSGYHIGIRFTRNIPVGKGLSSSTADMLAALRALQEVFGFLLTDRFVSRLFNEIEPHDALHYNNSVVYNHRKGRLIRDLQYIPSFAVVCVDKGGIVDTVAYNRTKVFAAAHMKAFDELLADLIAAFETADDRAIANCATRSAQLHAEMTGDKFLAQCLEAACADGILGVQATHSGTCAGFLFPGDRPAEQLQATANELAEHFGKIVFTARSLTLLR
jgi:L-threonine kinase